MKIHLLAQKLSKNTRFLWKKHYFNWEFQKSINIWFQIRAYGWEKCWKLINVRRTFIWNSKVITHIIKCQVTWKIEIWNCNFFSAFVVFSVKSESYSIRQLNLSCESLWCRLKLFGSWLKKIVLQKIIFICREIPLQFKSNMFWCPHYIHFLPISISSLCFSLSSEHTKLIWGEAVGHYVINPLKSGGARAPRPHLFRHPCNGLIYNNGIEHCY